LQTQVERASSLPGVSPRVHPGLGCVAWVASCRTAADRRAGVENLECCFDRRPGPLELPIQRAPTAL